MRCLGSESAKAQFCIAYNNRDGATAVQIYDRGWDQPKDLPRDLASQFQGPEQATAALLTDVKQRGLLDDTLVIWGGEFGRTIYCQGKLTEANYGRDHHGSCFTCGWPV